MIRHFNTSRELKQPKDTSTMDFAYFPDLDPDHNVDANLLAMRVPIIPDNYSPPRTGAHAPEVEEMVSSAAFISISNLDRSGEESSTLNSFHVSCFLLYVSSFFFFWSFFKKIKKKKRLEAS